jgi:hypothetical protein
LVTVYEFVSRDRFTIDAATVLGTLVMENPPAKTVLQTGMRRGKPGVRHLQAKLRALLQIAMRPATDAQLWDLGKRDAHGRSVGALGFK